MYFWENAIQGKAEQRNKYNLNGEEEQKKKKPMKFDFIISQMKHFNLPFLNYISRPNSVEGRAKCLSTV